MNKGKELAKNTAIISIGKISTQMISFLLLPLYTAVLSTEEYGVVDLVVTYVHLLLPICTLQLEQSIFRFVLDKRKDEQEKKRIFSEIFTLAIIAIVLFSVIYIVISPLIHSEFKYYLLINLIANIYGQLMLQSARGLGKNAAYAVGSFISAAGQVALNIVFVLILRWGPRGMFISMFLAFLGCGTYILISTKSYKYIRIVKLSKESITPYLKYSLPLIPNTISWWILNASDRTIILKFLGISANGIYSAANKFSGIYTTIFNIFNLSWTESVALHLNEKDSSDDFSKLQDSLIKFFGCMFLGLTAVMPLVFKILVNERYNAAYYQIPPLLMGAFFSAMAGFVSAYYVAAKMTSVIAKMTMLAAGLNIVINLLLVKQFGLYAASFSTLISYFVIFLLRYVDVRKRFKVFISRKMAISLMVMTMVVWACYYSEIVAVQIVCLAVIVIYSFIQNKDMLMSLLKMVKNKIG